MQSPGQDQAAQPDNPPSTADEAGVEVLKDKFKLDERAAYKLSEVSWPWFCLADWRLSGTYDAVILLIHVSPFP